MSPAGPFHSHAVGRCCRFPPAAEKRTIDPLENWTRLKNPRHWCDSIARRCLEREWNPLLTVAGHASDRCMLRDRDALITAGAVVGQICARRRSPGRARGGRRGLRRFARRAPRRTGPNADPAPARPVPVRPPLARGGRALGLLPAGHLPRRRRSGDLRSGLPARALARCRTGAAGDPGFRVEWVPGLHGVRVLRRRRDDLPPLLGRHDARQLRPRRLRRPGWRERAGRAALHGDDPRWHGSAPRGISFPDRAGRCIRLCGAARGGGWTRRHDPNDAVLPGARRASLPRQA